MHRRCTADESELKSSILLGLDHERRSDWMALLVSDLDADRKRLVHPDTSPSRLYIALTVQISVFEIKLAIITTEVVVRFEHSEAGGSDLNQKESLGC